MAKVCAEGKYQSTADLLFDWFGFGQISKSVSNLLISKSAESKPVKQEVQLYSNTTSLNKVLGILWPVHKWRNLANLVKLHRS